MWPEFTAVACHAILQTGSVPRQTTVQDLAMAMQRAIMFTNLPYTVYAMSVHVLTNFVKVVVALELAAD